VFLGWAGWVFPSPFPFILYWFCFAMNFSICAIKKNLIFFLKGKKESVVLWEINWELGE
jgi:hypothetical protein